MTTGLDYPLTIRPLSAEEGGGWLCEFPDLPGCMADGATPEEAVREGADALRSCVLTLRELGRPVPPPSRPENSYSGRWLMRVPKGLHRRLAEQARAEGVSLNALAATLLAEGLGYRRARQATDRRLAPARSA
jgi:antitoxin HicB